jgi:beta-lactam-binding protein with PASTA domain
MATYRQRSWLPWWLVPAVPLLILAAVLVFLLMPKKATVPDLTKLSSRFAVQQALTKAELNPVPQVNRVQTGGKPGTIVAQAPAAGQKVKKGSLVTIQVVVGSGEVVVPKIVGLKVQAAAGALDQAGLKLGEVLPAPPDPNGTIGSQIPAAGKAAHPGDGVMVFIAKTPPAKPGGNAAAASGGKKAVPVPKVAGKPVAQAAAALAQAGLLPTEVQRYAAAKPGTLIGTVPPAGKSLAKGTKITLLVSAGFPQLLFDTADGLMQVQGTGGQARPLAGTSPGDSEATWSSDASHIAFVSGDDILLAVPGKPGTVLLHRSGKSFRDPTFAPAGQVLAVVKRNATDGDLCLSRVGTTKASLSCINDPTTDVGRSVSWSPDGRSILVAAHPKDKPDTFGLILYRSAVPFSTRASDWSGRLVTDASQAGRGTLAGAFSPDGKRLALASNQAGGGFQLYVTQPDDFKLAKAAVLPVAACSLAWRPDGAELAVVSNPGCQAGVLGQIARVDPAHPNQVVALAAQGAHPAWQPLKLGS